VRIFGWAADRAGCGYYRMGLPLHEMAKHGHDIQVSINRTGWEATADVIVGQRVCNPGPSSWWQGLGSLPTGKRPLMVYELDDDLWGVHPDNDTAYRYFQDGTGRKEAMVLNALCSDLVTTTTPWLADVIRSQVGPNCPPVVVIPNVVDEALFSLELPYHQEPILGWAGSGTHRPDFRVAGPQVARFLRRNPGIVWHSVGADFIPATPGIREHTPWVDSVEEYYRSLDFTVGIAPLMSHPFNRSKSPIKALEYAARGIPTVASDYGPYADFVVHGETGLLVRQDHEWVKYLHSLFHDPARRAIMAEKARRRASIQTVQNQWVQWERAYEGASHAV